MTQIDKSRRALTAFALLLAAGMAAPAVAQAKNRRTRTRKGKNKNNDTADIQRRKLEEQRLLRECRGRPNAGACLGYAS